MKNLFILPTDKPSRLAILHDGKLHIGTNFKKDLNVNPQNIYITNDEEIKGFENNIWVYNNGRVWLWQNTMALRSDNKPKKIILTTDQDLIKDGVQSIDDEFLEWFVKNPSCEKVEVKDSSIVKEHIWDGSNDGEIIWEKEIIIPKEEYKLELDCPYDFTSRCTMGRCDCKSKQETLEEAFGNYIKKRYHLPIRDSEPDFESAKFGAKWQQKRMYSEEEVKFMINKLASDCYFMQEPNQDVAKWFEKFKKR